MTPDSMLATIAQAGDTPRKGHVAAAYDLPKVALEVLGGDLTNEGEIAHKIGSGSINQSGGYRAALYSVAPEQARAGVIVVLRRQLVELLGSEFLSPTYATINRGWVLAIYLVAQRVGDREVEALALEVYRRMIAVELALECPATAHPDLRWRTVAPAGRAGDRNGMAEERDQARAVETTGKLRWPLKQEQRDVEVWMVLHAVESGRLPRLEPAPLESIGTRWVLDVRYFLYGHEARFRSMETAIGAIDGVSVDYRMPIAQGNHNWRHGMAVESVGWDHWAPRWKGGRPEGWKLKWRPGAPPLPQRDLGPLQRTVVIGASADVDRPEPPHPPPPGPKPPEPPEPPSPKKKWRHVALTEEGGKRGVVLRVSPPEAQIDLELLRIVDLKGRR